LPCGYVGHVVLLLCVREREGGERERGGWGGLGGGGGTDRQTGRQAGRQEQGQRERER